MPRFDDLRNGPIASSAGADEEAAQELLRIIEFMRGGGHCEWAEETLNGIYDGVAERKYATANQRRAVENIWAAAFKGKAYRDFGDCD